MKDEGGSWGIRPKSQRKGDTKACNLLPQEEAHSNTGEHLISSHTHTHTHTPFSEGVYISPARDDGGTSRDVHILMKQKEERNNSFIVLSWVISLKPIKYLKTQ